MKRTVIAVLLLVALLTVAACGTKAKTDAGAPTASAVPEAASGSSLPSGTIQAVSTVDIFSSGFTSTDGTDYWVTVKLGEPDAPKPGDTSIQSTIGGSSQIRDMGKLLVVGENAGTIYATPQGMAQATMSDSASGWNLVVDFTAQKVVKVTLTGDGAPVELQRQ